MTTDDYIKLAAVIWLVVIPVASVAGFCFVAKLEEWFPIVEKFFKTMGLLFDDIMGGCVVPLLAFVAFPCFIFIIIMSSLMSFSQM